MKNTTRQTMKKTLAALLAAAGMTSTCVPVYAEDTPALTEAAYTVTEDEQGTVTIAFNEPIILSLEESYAGSEAEEDGGIIPYGDVAYECIPEKYWGAYISSDGNFYLSIRPQNHITFRGTFDGEGEIFCNGADIKPETVYLYAERENGENFSATYSSYTKIRGSQYIQGDKDISIIGRYKKSNRTFSIHNITYYFN